MLRVLPTHPDCKYCESLKTAGALKHVMMVIHRTTAHNVFLGVCNQCHRFWLQDKHGWREAAFVDPQVESSTT